MLSGRLVLCVFRMLSWAYTIRRQSYISITSTVSNSFLDSFRRLGIVVIIQYCIDG
jgi:hypothetical protein